MVGNPPNKKTLPSKQMDEDHLYPSLSFEKKGQTMEQMNGAHQCSSCAMTEKNILCLRDDLTAVQKKLEDADELVAEKVHEEFKRQNLNVRVADLEKANQEIVNRLNETLNRMSTENEKLRVEMAQQHCSAVKKNEESINTLYELEHRILLQNNALKVNRDAMIEVFKKQCRVVDEVNRRQKSIDDSMSLLKKKIENIEIIVAGSNVAVEHLGAAENRKIKNNQVSYSFPSC
jgi:prophage DNA circulation protein